MRTTLKRGVGRAGHAAANGNGKLKAVFPPGTASKVTRYEQPPAQRRSGLRLFARIVVVTFLVLSSLIAGIAGGSYLYFHQSVSDVEAHTPAVKRAAAALDIAPPNAPAIALVLGYDHRAGTAASDPSLSDTIMLIRADPVTKSISLLSFPRDLIVPIYCGSSSSDKVGHVVTDDRINSAYSRCGPKGSLLTVKHLIGDIPISFLITINFHGFKEVVDKLGGIYMDVDRRYYNRNTGSSYDDYANINLQPGYQLLKGESALDFVRFRHTDDDLHRNARQQQFVRAMREQVAQKVSVFDIPALVHDVTSNIEVAGHVTDSVVKSWALFALGLPNGHFFQNSIQNVICNNTCTTAPSNVEQAVQQFTTPDVQSSKVANAAALGNKIKQKTPPPSSVTVTVLNGSNVAGAAANTSYLLHQHGYQTEVPPNNVQADAPIGRTYFHSIVYYDASQPKSKLAAVALQNLIQPADLKKLPRDLKLRALDPGSMLLVVLGTAFSGTIEAPVQQPAPVHHPAYVTFDAAASTSLLQPLEHKVDFPLMVPTELEASSSPDTLPGDKPVRMYWIDKRGGHKAVRLVYHSSITNSFWGVEETNWDDAPALRDKSFRHDLGGREFDLYYSGSHLQMVVLHAHGASYWVINSLLDQLSNETMLAIAAHLKPLTAVK